MKNRMHFTVVFSFIVVMFIILNSVVPGMAAPVIIHQGSAAPEDEGWIKSTGTGEHKMEGGSETTLSGVHEYWRVEDNSKIGGSLPRYLYSLSPEELAGDWIFEISLRMTGSFDTYQFMGVYDGLNEWAFVIRPDRIYIANEEWSFMTPVNFSDYHTLRIEFSQNGEGTENDTADFYIDGMIMADGLLRSGQRQSNGMRTFFGSAGSSLTGSANYEYVSFDNGSPTHPVPIPGSFSIMVIGAIAVWGIRKIRL